MKIASKIYSISDILSWDQRGELVIQPAFQRRPSWSYNARSYLIDTIVRGLPIPKIFIRERIDLEEKTTIRDVVDGQQRLRSILEFIYGQLAINRTHNRELAGMTFDDLSKEAQEDFLSYPISTDLLIGASDADVLNVFSRINSYTLVLNAQEKLNAEFIGPFKQLVYQLAYEHYEFWVQNSILTPSRMARMADAELVSEIVVGMVHGLQSGKAYLKRYYQLYEIEFSQEDRVRQQFHRNIDLIASIFDTRLKETPFSRAPLFYSLFLALHDIIYGIGEESFDRPFTIPKAVRPKIFDSLTDLGKQITASEPDEAYESLHAASTRRTTNVGERKIRHEYFKDAIKRCL